MELQQFPKGKKFYNLPTKRAQSNASKLMSKEYLDALKIIKNFNTCSSEFHSSQSAIRLLNNIEILSDEEFPKIKLKNTHFLQCIDGNLSKNIVHRAAYYQTPERIIQLDNMPYFKGMIIQWDNQRNGVILHNTTYEGELIPTKESVKVKRDIRSHIDHILGDVNMFTLLGETMYVPYNMTWMSSVEEAKSLDEIFFATQDTYPTKEQIIQLAISCKAYTYSYNYENKPYVHEHSHKLVKTNNKPKLHTSARTKIIYKLGGLTLPDNYMDWFDG